MTFSQAIETIEKAASRIELRYKNGDLMEPPMVVAMAAQHIGEAWEKAAIAVQNGDITPFEYCAICLPMIDLFAKDIWRTRAERKLSVQRDPDPA